MKTKHLFKLGGKTTEKKKNTQKQKQNKHLRRLQIRKNHKLQQMCWSKPSSDALGCFSEMTYLLHQLDSSRPA